MTMERKVEIGIVLLVIAVLAGLAWKQHEANDAAKIEAAASDAQVRTLQEQIDQRKAADAAQQKAAAAAQAAVKTTGDAVRVIREVVQVPIVQNAPPVTQPQAVTAKPADIADAVKQQMPESPSYIVETQEQSIATAKTLLQCRADQQSLSSCQQDKLDMQAQLEAKQKEADAWKKAAKGGSAAQRFFKVAKCVGLSAGGAAAGQVIGGQPRWAAVGAAAGATACNFVF